MPVRQRTLFPILIAAAWLLPPIAARAIPPPAPESEGVAACARVGEAAVRPLLTLMPLAIRASHAPGRNGGTACTWDAVDPGLTADAPPRFQLTATVYELPSAARTAQLFHRQYAAKIVPSLVHTGADGDVEVARPAPDEVALRDGQRVVVIEAAGQQEEVQWQAGRLYRLEALALALAGDAALGPIDPNTLRDACEPLPPQQVLGILTLQPSSLQHDGDDKRCTLEVKDGSVGISGWVYNHGEAEIRRTDLGTHAAALAFQHQQSPFLPTSQLVQTTDPGDRLVADATEPDQAYAVHGATYIEFHVEDVTPAARAAPGWLYRVQRLALEAAGATVAPQPGQPADPVVPPPVPRLERSPGRDDPAVAWTPPPHPAPAMAGVLDGPVALVAWVTHHRFFLLSFIALLPIGLALTSKGNYLPRAAGRWLGLLAVIVIPLFVVNLVAGTWVSTWLVYHLGEAGSATITASRPTGTVYNNHFVRAYDVLIRTAEGPVVETGFADDDFNIYPQHNLTRYPAGGDRFTVRYLRHYPKNFVIVGDDGSPWAHGLVCDRLEQQVQDAVAKNNFAPDSAAYRAAMEAAQRTLQTAGCAQ